MPEAKQTIPATTRFDRAIIPHAKPPMKTQSLQMRLRKIEDAKNKIVDREKKIRLALSIREKEDNKKLCWLIGHLMITHRTDASIRAAMAAILPMLKPPFSLILTDLLQPSMDKSETG